MGKLTCEKRPKTFETFALIVFGVHAFPSTTLGLVSILPTYASAGLVKDPDMLDSISGADPKKTTPLSPPKVFITDTIHGQKVKHPFHAMA